MDLHKRWQKIWQKWRSKSKNETHNDQENDHKNNSNATEKTLDSLKELLNDEHIPATVRMQLNEEFQQVQQLLDKLENQQVHIVAFGKVSSGKSSLLNALIGKHAFSTSPLHGETKRQKSTSWNQYNEQSMVVIDTPGTDEVNGEARQKMAQNAAAIADIVLFVIDGDMTQSQLKQLKGIAQPNTQILVVLNKADLYTEDELDDLKSSLITKTTGLISLNNIVMSSAAPLPQVYITVDKNGKQTRKKVTVEIDVLQVKQRIWDILEQDGKTLTALNASIFAGEISRKIAEKITTLRSSAAEKVVTTYSIAKGIGVAFNPVPVADLLIAASLDVAMIHKLSQVYGLPIVGKEATKLSITIMAQIAALMGAVWGVNLISSALKTVSVGLSTTITAGAQGALAYYATYLVGKIAEQYFIRGKSWGKQGPKQVAKNIVNNLDKNSILREARAQILNKIKSK